MLVHSSRADGAGRTRWDESTRPCTQLIQRERLAVRAPSRRRVAFPPTRRLWGRRCRLFRWGHVVCKYRHTARATTAW